MQDLSYRTILCTAPWHSTAKGANHSEADRELVHSACIPLNFSALHYWQPAQHVNWMKRKAHSLLLLSHCNPRSAESHVLFWWEVPYTFMSPSCAYLLAGTTQKFIMEYYCVTGRVNPQSSKAFVNFKMNAKLLFPSTTVIMIPGSKMSHCCQKQAGLGLEIICECKSLS